MGMTKQAVTDEPIAKQEVAQPQMQHIQLIDGVPIDVYRYFSITPGSPIQHNDREQLKRIYNYLKQDSQGIGDVIVKLKGLERKMGEPQIGEKRYSRIFNYVVLKEGANRYKEAKRNARENILNTKRKMAVIHKYNEQINQTKKIIRSLEKEEV